MSGRPRSPAFPRRLRDRLGLVVVVAVVTALAAAALLADLWFGRSQRLQFEDLMERDLERVQSVVRAGVPGQQFLAEGVSGARLQFVARDGTVLLPDPEATPIRLLIRPEVVRSSGAVEMVGSAPWVLPSGLEIGTLRLALDMSESLAARASLRWGLLVSAAVVAALATALTLWQIGRSLRPLARLAEQAAAVDPAAPVLARYRGPQDEVAEVARALNLALQGIRARQQAERDALAEVAHELAGPLTVVAGRLHALAEAQADDRQVLAARDAANELLHTSQDLLTLARGELERTPELSLVDLAEVVRGLAAEYPGLAIEDQTEDAGVFAHADRLRQVARNLTRNAVQASGGVEGVHLRLYAEEGEVVLAVIDQGPGLSPEALSRVFDRHVSGRPGGSGLGLSVAQGIAKAFGGRVTARSTLGEGATFELRLPGWRGELEEG